MRKLMIALCAVFASRRSPGKVDTGILVLGATKTPWDLDPAIRRRFEKRVYIPLPDPRARYVMFKQNIGSTTNDLTEQDLQLLAAETEGFSGSDISVLVRDALYEPVRIAQIATYFKKVPDPSGQMEFLWEPCSSGDKQAKEMSLYDIQTNQLKPLDTTIAHFEHSVRSTKPSVLFSCSVKRDALLSLRRPCAQATELRTFRHSFLSIFRFLLNASRHDTEYGSPSGIWQLRSGVSKSWGDRRVGSLQLCFGQLFFAV